MKEKMKGEFACFDEKHHKCMFLGQKLERFGQGAAIWESTRNAVRGCEKKAGLNTRQKHS